MRKDIMLLAVAVLGIGVDRVVTRLSPDPALRMRMAQNVGPLPTPAVNPGLGAAPPGGHLPGSVESARDAARGAAQGSNAIPANPTDRLGTMNENHLGTPPVGALPDAAGGAVPAASAGAVPPPAAGAVQPPPGANVAPAPVR